MAAFLSRAKVTQGENFYCFLTTKDLYNSEFETATGIVSATPDADFADYVLSTVKQLTQAGVLKTAKVLVTDSNGANPVTKKLHFSSDKAATIEIADGGAKGLTWPVGKGSGGTIDKVFTSAKVSSRQ